MIQELLYKYLVLNGHLGLPEIGQFTVQRKPASIDASGTALLSPTYQLHFEQQAVQADKNLFLFLVEETETDEVTVIGTFNDWVKSVKDQLNQQATAALPFMGLLRKNEAGGYHFEPLTNHFGTSSVELPQGHIWQVDTAEETAEEEKTDSGWWIYAIIFLLLGIAAIAYHYL
jgi:hypothetical protein